MIGFQMVHCSPYEHRKAVLLESVPTEISNPNPIQSNPNPLIAFEHLSLYLQEHLSVQKHSIVICNIPQLSRPLVE